MKVKFKYGIKSYSGTLDDMVFANFEDRNVVIGRMLPADREATPQNEIIASNSRIISTFYKSLSAAYKQDLTEYAKKMFNLKAYSNRVAGSGYSVFNKIIWAANDDTGNPLDISSLSADDIVAGTYPQIDTIKAAVENGYIPMVGGYEEFNNPLV